MSFPLGRELSFLRAWCGVCLASCPGAVSAALCVDTAKGRRSVQTSGPLDSSSKGCGRGLYLKSVENSV